MTPRYVSNIFGRISSVSFSNMTLRGDSVGDGNRNSDVPEEEGVRVDEEEDRVQRRDLKDNDKTSR